MDLTQVEQLITDRGIEVVKVGGPDMDGVFRGKRILSSHFLEGCKSGGFPQCDVIFGWDIQEAQIDGLAVGSAETGFADIIMQPDLSTFRPVPWEAAAAAVICDYAHEDGQPVAVSPRHVLRRGCHPLSSLQPRAVASSRSIACGRYYGCVCPPLAG